jgi:hypothetical protein
MGAQDKNREETPQDKRFQDKLLRMIEWVADRDPVAAARLIGDYTDDLMRELAGSEPTPNEG